MWCVNVVCHAWRYAIIFLTLISMITMWHQHTVGNAFDFLVNVALGAWVWHDYVQKTYRYDLQIHCNDGTVIERKFLSLDQRYRIVGSLVESGAWKVGEK